jgi:hypothetical protein
MAALSQKIMQRQDSADVLQGEDNIVTDMMSQTPNESPRTSMLSPDNPSTSPAPQRRRKARGVPLLHKRSASPTRLDLSNIQSTDLDELAINTAIPQWLIYSWVGKITDKTLVDRQTQRAILEVLPPSNQKELRVAVDFETVCGAVGLVFDADDGPIGRRSAQPARRLSARQQNAGKEPCIDLCVFGDGGKKEWEWIEFGET